MTNTTDAINKFLNAATMAFARRQGEQMRAAGIEIPEIKGVQFKRTKNQHKPMRNSVTRVVMVGFDPFNHSGLPEHIERQVVHDYWSGLEMQFVQDWVNEAPEGEIRIGGMLNLYGDDTSYKPFPEPVYALDILDEDVLRTHIANTFGLPEHLMKPSLHFGTHVNEVSYNGVKLSSLDIPEHLVKTRELVVEMTKEVNPEDYDSLLTLFVSRGGDIRHLTEFFAIVKEAVPAPIQRTPPVRSREDERGHEEYLRDSVRGIFPFMVLEQTAPDRSGDLDHTKLAVKPTPEQREELEKATDMVTVFDNGEFIPQAKAYYTDAQGNKKDLRSLDLMGLLLGISPEPEPIEGELVDKGVEVRVISDDELPPEPTGPAPVLSGRMSMRRPNPIREHWEKHGDPYEGRIPHIQQFVDITKQTSQPNRSPWGRVPVIDHTSEGFLTLVDDRGNPVSKEEQLEYEQAILKAQEEELTPEEIADREQAIQEASEGKLDYLLEGTQWDPKNRKN